MKTYRKINAESGMFIEDVRVKTMPVDEYDYIEEPVKGTFYKPKWDGEKWEEGATEIPEPTPPQPSETDLLMLAIADLDMQRELDKTEQQVAMAELAEIMLGGQF